MKKRTGLPDLTAVKIEEMLADGMRRAAELVQMEFEWASKFCESPIETLFLAALCHPMTANEYDERLEVIRPPSGLIANAYPPPMPGIYVYPQITIGDYRVDFLLYSVGYPKMESLIVELDGHDFHERTKEQARRDKSRDRALVSQGYRVVRFTGSEIFADALEAAREAISVLKRLDE